MKTSPLFSLFGLLLLCILPACLPIFSEWTTKECPEEPAIAEKDLTVHQILSFYESVSRMNQDEFNENLARLTKKNNQPGATIADEISLLVLQIHSQSPHVDSPLQSALEEKAKLSPELAGLVNLFKTIANQRQTIQSKTGQADLLEQQLTTAQAELNRLEGELTQCQAEAQTLSEQIQQLREIEKIIIDRERSTSTK